MQITETQLQRFIELYRKELNISLSPVEAQQKAISLLRFLEISVTPFDIKENGDSKSFKDEMASFKDREEIVRTREYLSL